MMNIEVLILVLMEYILLRQNLYFIYFQITILYFFQKYLYHQKKKYISLHICKINKFSGYRIVIIKKIIKRYNIFSLTTIATYNILSAI